MTKKLDSGKGDAAGLGNRADLCKGPDSWDDVIAWALNRVDIGSGSAGVTKSLDF